MIIKNPKTMNKIKFKLVLTEDNDLPCAVFSDACNLSRKNLALKIVNSLICGSKSCRGDVDTQIAAPLS